MLIASINNVYYIHWRSFFICIHTYKKAAKNSFGFYSCTIHSMGSADLAMATDKIKFIPQSSVFVHPKSSHQAWCGTKIYMCTKFILFYYIQLFLQSIKQLNCSSKAVTKRHLWNCQELRFRPESKSYKPQPWVLSPEQRHLRRPWNSLHNQPFVHWHWPQCQLAISVCSSAKDTDTHTHGEHIMINRENCCK